MIKSVPLFIITFVKLMVGDTIVVYFVLFKGQLSGKLPLFF